MGGLTERILAGSSDDERAELIRALQRMARNLSAD
jgi:DNA-binding MarR family transcriptional regulator